MPCRLAGSSEDSMNNNFLLMINSMKLQRTDEHKDLGIHHIFSRKKTNKLVCDSFCLLYVTYGAFVLRCDKELGHSGLGKGRESLGKTEPMALRICTL